MLLPQQEFKVTKLGLLSYIQQLRLYIIWHNNKIKKKNYSNTNKPITPVSKKKKELN